MVNAIKDAHARFGARAVPHYIISNCCSVGFGVAAGFAGEAVEFGEPCVEAGEPFDGVAAEGGLHGEVRGLVQKVRDCEVGAGLPISSHVKCVWRWVLEKPRFCQKESSGW